MTGNAADVWVGSWRPHKPRGPIAALYNSPGPKYALPGLTGVGLHDPSRRKAPAFSFGSRHDMLGSNCSPGPGSCLLPSNTTRRGKDGSPAYSLYGRPRDPQVFKTPGPGQYAPEQSGKSTRYTAPVYSMSARSREFPSDKTPGPAAYMLPSVLGSNTATLSSAPSFSLRGRSNIGSFNADLQKTPAPGTYKMVDPCTYKHKPPSYSMTGRNGMPGDHSRKPGPGAHHPEQVTVTRIRAPSFSFGVHHSQYIAPVIVNVVD